jgi:hypothetical protein
MSHSEQGHAAVSLPRDPARDGLSGAVESNVSLSRLAIRAGGQGGPNHGLIFLTPAQQQPTSFFIAAVAAAVLRILIEEGLNDASGNQDATQRFKFGDRRRSDFDERS